MGRRDLVADLKGVPTSLATSYLHRVHKDPSSITLCGFCDASTQAHAAIVNIALRSDSGVAIWFLVSKTTVAPLQLQSIPNLELLSALLLSKLVTSVMGSFKSTLPVTEVGCYTDSQVALYSIKGVWKPFLENGVREIRRDVNPKLWSHWPRKSNPTDLPSRGLTSLGLSVSQLWRHGPVCWNCDLYTQWTRNSLCGKNVTWSWKQG